MQTNKRRPSQTIITTWAKKCLWKCRTRRWATTKMTRSGSKHLASTATSRSRSAISNRSTSARTIRAKQLETLIQARSSASSAMHTWLTATSAARTSPRAAHTPSGHWRGTPNKTNYSSRTSCARCMHSASRSRRTRTTRWRSVVSIRKCEIWLSTGLRRFRRRCAWTSKSPPTTPSSSWTDSFPAT